MKALKPSVTSVLFALALHGVAMAQDGGTEASSANPVFYLNRDAVIVVDSGPRLGHMMTSVLKSASTNADTVYYPPALLPEWAEYRAQVYEACSIAGEPTDLDRSGDNNSNNAEIDLEPIEIEIPLTIHIDDRFYVEEMFQHISKMENNGVNKNASLRPIPFSRIIIQLNIPGSSSPYVLHDSSRRGNLGDLRAPEYFEVYERYIISKVSANCDEHNDIINAFIEGSSDILMGVIYTKGTRYDLTEARAQLSSAMARAVEMDIFSDESFYYEAQSGHESSVSTPLSTGDQLTGGLGGLIINLMGGNKATADTRVSATASMHRIVNRNFLEGISKINAERLQLFCESPSAQRCIDISKQLLEFLIKRGEEITLTFEKESDNSIKLMHGQVAYVTLNSQQFSTLLEAAPDFSQTESENRSVTIGSGAETGTPANISGTRSTTSDTKFKDDITWKLEGGVPVPTSANLIILSKSSLEKELDLAWSMITPIRSEEVSRSAVYPSKGYRHLAIDRARQSQIDTPGFDIVIPYNAYQDHIYLKERCETAAMDKTIDASNLQLGHGDRIIDFNPRTARHEASGTRCEASLNVTWTASPGYFFFIDRDPPVIFKFFERGPTEQHISPVPHPDNVLLRDNWSEYQAASAFRVDAKNTRGRSMDNSRCYAHAELVARHVSEQCIPYLLKDLPR